MVDGIEYTLTISNPVGQRVTALTHQGQVIQPDDVYSLVINNYRASGGGNFTMITDCPTLSEINTDMTDILIQTLESHPDLKLSHKNNILVTL
jgi:2',3'-cyclic-nucleotide 2'-phosphodiesterase/3'-nucleotidase